MMDRRRQTFADTQSSWARQLLEGLVDAGVREIVISPGSRSSPLVLAALDTAARDTAADDREIRCHTVVDERSAAFFALGCAKATGHPAVLICTSGSAGTHYLPALVEARHAFVPMIVLTADRPHQLMQCGANQAIDQTKLFGEQVVGFFDVGLADADPAAQRALRRVASQAVSRSHWPTPGGVHLNVRFRKPLEPATDSLDAVSPGASPSFDRPVLSPSSQTLKAIADALRTATRPMIVIGPMPIDEAIDPVALETIAQAAGALLITEATSQIRFRGAGVKSTLRADAWGTTFRHAETLGLPDMILQLGAPPTARAWPETLRAAVDAGARHWVAAVHGWPDPESTAATMIRAEPAILVNALAEALGTPAAPKTSSAWIDRWRRADAMVWKAADRLLANETALSEATVVRRATAALRDGDLFSIGNSLPVRLLDAWVPGDRVESGVDVLHQRGTSGIDGLLSSAAGASLATGRRTLLLLGDVSFLHDLGGLAIARSAREPLVVLVLDNGGGRIFDLLPIADHPAAKDRFEPWHTPPHIDFAAAAKTFGVAFHQAADQAQLDTTLDASLARPGLSLIVASTPAGGAAHDLRALATAFDSTFAAMDGDPEVRP